MKRALVLLILVVAVGSPLVSQSFYFDGGLGLGSATTLIDGVDFSSNFDDTVTETGVDLGIKVGFGPLGDTALYVVGEFAGIGHRFSDSYNFIQFNSYLLGPGVIYYPIPLVQLAASFGISYVANQTDLPVVFYNSEKGFAGEVSAALDFGSGSNALLLGLRYSYTNNTLFTSGSVMKSSLADIFLKYAYRQKGPQTTEE